MHDDADAHDDLDARTRRRYWRPVPAAGGALAIVGRTAALGRRGGRVASWPVGVTSAVIAPEAGIPVALATFLALVVGYGRALLALGSVGLLVAVDWIVTNGQGTSQLRGGVRLAHPLRIGGHLGVVRRGRPRCRRVGPGGAGPSHPTRRRAPMTRAPNAHRRRRRRARRARVRPATTGKARCEYS